MAAHSLANNGEAPAGVFVDVSAPARDETDRRILAAVIELATEGGYDAVRQREVASRAGVALGTLYARFDGKNGLLAAALQLDAEQFVGAVRKRPLDGDTPLDRVTLLFEYLTEELLRRPNLARASLRAATCGEHAPSMRMMHAQQGLIDTVAGALRGSARPAALSGSAAYRVAAVLVMVWFANLTAWSGGLTEPVLIVEVVHQAADMLLHGVELR